MESTILLNATTNTRKVEEEEKTRFTRFVLTAMGIPVDNLWDENDELSTDNKLKLRQLLSAFNIEIIQNNDGELKIYNREKEENILLGEWNKPTYILKKDPSQLDPRKRLYLEMKVSYSSIFESQE